LLEVCCANSEKMRVLASYNDEAINSIYKEAIEQIKKKIENFDIKKITKKIEKLDTPL
jgi:ADP-dependent phosphofructokinase/glucokinase